MAENRRTAYDDTTLITCCGVTLTGTLFISIPVLAATTALVGYPIGSVTGTGFISWILIVWQISSWVLALIFHLFGNPPWEMLRHGHGMGPEKVFLALFYVSQISAYHAYRLVAATAAMIRTWWTILRSPYRAEIRAARRALAILLEENADPELVASAEAQVALWMTRHEHETKEDSDASAIARRRSRIDAARETLLRLDSSAEIDGLKPNAKRASEPTRVSGGS